MNFIFTGCSVLLAVTTVLAVPLSGQHHYYGNGLNRGYYSPYSQYSPYGQYYQPYSYGYYGNHGGYPNSYYQDYDGDGIADDNVDDYNNGYDYGVGRYVQPHLENVPVVGKTVSTLYQTHPSSHGYGSYGGAGYYRK